MDGRASGPIFIAGDFNARALESGSRTTNVIGYVLLEAFAKLDVVFPKIRTSKTYCGGVGVYTGFDNRFGQRMLDK